MNRSPEKYPGLTGDQIKEALARIRDKLAAQQIKGEICILGGAAMLLAFQARQTTKDVDAIFAPSTQVRQMAREIAEEMDLPQHWLNDGVKGFLSERHLTDPAKEQADDTLRITFPTANYLLAMKCLASRLSYGDEEHMDRADIKFLIKEIGYTTIDEVLANLEYFYKRDLILPKTQFLVETILHEMKNENLSDQKHPL